jgi:hypothetical protein
MTMNRLVLLALLCLWLVPIAIAGEKVYIGPGWYRVDSTKAITAPYRITTDQATYTDTLNQDTVAGDCIDLEGLKSLKIVMEMHAYTKADSAVGRPHVTGLVYVGPEKGAWKLAGTVTLAHPSNGDVNTLFLPADSLLNYVFIKTIVQDSVLNHTGHTASSCYWDVKYSFIKEEED